MAQTVVIDIEAQYRDKTSEGVKSSADDMERLRRKMEDTESAGKKANAALEKIATTAATIAKKTISIPVKIIDYATKPLRSLLNYATSLKGILTGIVMGQTAQKLFVSPTQYAETLKGHSLAFENLLGSAEAAAQMIQEIQAFDEKSPFNTMQIIEQSRMLMTYKLATQENVLSMIETIGDASMGVGAGDEGIEEGFADREAAVRLHRLLHALPEPYKEVFSLRTFGELSFAQIGELFGKSESWARVTYFRARQKLKEALER